MRHRTSNPLSVVLAEPSGSMREAIGGLLHRAPDIELVGHAHDRVGLFRALEAHRPDVLLLDPGAAGPHGVTALPMICAACAATSVLVADFPHWPGYEDDVRRLGASGFVSKLAAPASWLAAIREAPGTVA